jgi:hypothetical protein
LKYQKKSIRHFFCRKANSEKEKPSEEILQILSPKEIPILLENTKTKQTRRIFLPAEMSIGEVSNFVLQTFSEDSRSKLLLEVSLNVSPNSKLGDIYYIFKNNNGFLVFVLE